MRFIISKITAKNNEFIYYYSLNLKIIDLFIYFSDNKQAVVRELFNSSNNPDELSVLDDSNSSEKGKTYDGKHPGSTRSVVAEDTPQHYSNSMINYNII